MKMNFNFNFNIEHSPASPNQSIRRITTVCDQDHTAEIRPWSAMECREGIGLFERERAASEWNGDFATAILM